MSTLLTPIITQLEIDRDRFRVLVNGEESDTVQLEDRIEKSIAGQVADRIDALAVSLTDAVEAAQDSRDLAIAAREDASEIASSVQSSVQTAQGFSESAESFSGSAKTHKEETEFLRDEVRDLVDTFNTNQSYLPRYEVASFEVEDDQGEHILNIEMATVWRIDGSKNWTLSFPSEFEFEDDRSQAVTVIIEGSGGNITWPSEISWEVREPLVSGDWTRVDLTWTGTQWIGSSLPPTDLSVSRSGNTLTIESSTGNNADIPTASTSHTGLMSTGDKSKLDGIEAGAQVNPTIVNNLNSTSSTSVLSANQGRELKGMIDSIDVSITASDLPTNSAARDWVLARTAAASVGAVGTYAMLRWNPTSDIDTGDTTSGSNLRYSNAEGAQGERASGTWRLMGIVAVGTGQSASRSSLWLRIS